MTSADLVLAVAALAAIGIATGLAASWWRRGQYIARQDRTALAGHRREVAAAGELAAVLEELREMIPAIVDAQRRYGFPLGPRVTLLAAEVDPADAGRALLQLVPGLDNLGRHGARATDRFSCGGGEPFAGWIPPAALEPVAEKPRTRRRRQARVLSLPEASSDIPGRGPDGATAEPSGSRLAGGEA